MIVGNVVAAVDNEVSKIIENRSIIVTTLSI